MNDSGFTFRLLTLEELLEAYQIVEDGRAFLKESGSSQWQHGRPSKELLSQDIEEQKLYGLFSSKGKMAAICALSSEEDPSYRNIYEGKWLTSGSIYLTVHTLAFASSYRGKHLSGLLFSFIEEEGKKRNIRSIRGDTYRKNLIMQKVFAKAGFTYCGIIYLINEKIDNDRLAYEKIIS
jgi:GNAT superfamily N-acetyltransferase